MPYAGQTIKAADFAGCATNVQGADEINFNTTTYTLGGATCGTSFTAPTSGSVKITWGARMNLNSATAVRLLVSAQVASGSSVGSGTVVDAANDGSALEIGVDANSRLEASKVRVVTGLTAGSVYNVALYHRNVTSVASAATITDREVYVEPWFG